jgi:hypothetical protein
LNNCNYLIIHSVYSLYHFEVIEGAFEVFQCFQDIPSRPNPNPEYESLGGTPRFPEISATTRVHHHTLATSKTCSIMSQQVFKVINSLLVYEQIYPFVWQSNRALFHEHPYHWPLSFA